MGSWGVSFLLALAAFSGGFASESSVSGNSASAARKEDCSNQRVSLPVLNSKGSLKNFQIVLVSGIFNETREGDFTEFKREIISNYEVPEDQVTIVNPSSFLTVDEQSELLNLAFRKISRETAKQLVVFAHSMAGAATLLAELKYRDLIPETVQTTILMQPAFGSEFATATDIYCNSFPGYLIRGCNKARFYKTGLHSLRKANIDEVFLPQFRNISAEESDKLDKNVFYLRASGEGKSVRFGSGMKFVHMLLKKFYGENDGAVALTNQHLCGVGTDFDFVVPGAHSALVYKKQNPDELELTSEFLRLILKTAGYFVP